MRSVIQEIKSGNIGNLYLFYGEETYKKLHYKNTLKESVTGGNLLNYAEFEGKNTDWQAVYDVTQTLPFLAAKRLVIVENSGQFKAKGAADGAEEPAAGKSGSISWPERIINELPETCCLAFFEDAAAKNKKIYKLAAAKGVVCECNADTEEVLVQWLARGFASEGKKVRRSTLELLVGRVGLSYEKLRTEYEKIISYAAGRNVIEDSDVMAVSSQTVESRIFDLLGALSEKNVKVVLQKYYDLLENNEHPLYILAMLRSQFRTMLQIAELYDKGLSEGEIAKAAGKPGFVVRKTRGYLRNFSRRQLEQILDEISDVDRRSKIGEIKDQLGVEMLLMKFSG